MLLKASAISGRALSATVLENLHENRKYANDLRNVMSLLQPGLVDMGAQVGAAEACAEDASDVFNCARPL